jgi:signal transduction histidine kinase
MNVRRLLPGLMLLNALALVGGFVLLPADSFLRLAVLDLGQAFAALLAALALLGTARGGGGLCRPAFVALGAGCASWGFGQVVWSWYELVLRVENPFPSLADVGYIAGIALLGVGVVLWPKQGGKFSRGELVDAALIAGVAVLFSLQFVLLPIAETLDGFSVEAVFLLTYPLSDLAILSVVVGGLLLQGWAERGRLLIVSAALFALVFADTYFSLLGDSYATGQYADLGWTTAFVLAGAAALLPSGWQRERAARVRAGAVGATLTALLAVLIGVTFVNEWDHHRMQALNVLGIGLMLVLLVARTSHSARVRTREAGELARAQAELVKAYAVRDGALEASRTGVCVFGTEGEARFANTAFVSLLGPARSWDAFVARIRRLAGGEPRELGQLLRVWSEDGRYLSLGFAPLPTGELLATVDDLTDTERERQLRGRLVAETVAAQEREARRIGELLHDDAVQQLTALGLRLELEAQRSALPSLTSLASECGSIISSLRLLLGELSPAVLESRGLTAAIDAAAETLRSRGVDVSVRPFAARLAPELERLVYRLVQEAFSNVLKHSSASRVDVHLATAGGSLRCRVTDDGAGFDPDRLQAAVQDGLLGLSVVRERVELAGGRLLVESRPGHGTAFSFELPLDPAAVLVQPEAREGSA